MLFKILFQAVCKSQADWDDPLDSDIEQQWAMSAQDLRQTKAITVERYYFSDLSPSDVSTIQIHGFSDASESAYGAVVYLRVETNSGNIVTKLVTSKSRVAPIKGETIPRLELMGAVVLARLINSVQSALSGTLKFNDAFCWVDSQIALWWIWGTTKEFKQFVQNRVLEVRRLVKPEHWNYCPTDVNPADIVSRGTVDSKLADNKLWWSGPEFLQSDQTQWPRLERIPVPDGSTSELRNKKAECEDSYSSQDTATLVTEVGESVELNLEYIIPCEDYSDVQRLFRVTAYVLRFVGNLKRKLENGNLVYGEIQKEEVSVSKELWYKEVQRPILQDSKFKQFKVSLSLYTNERGVLRSGGPIHNASLPHDATFPILLPKNSHFTNLIIRASHEKGMHNGVIDTLTELRTQFWVPCGRLAVKSVIARCARCARCRRIEGRSSQVPPPPPLPESRVADEFAYSRVGVDFAGPIYVPDIYSDKPGTHKAYIALFTCATSRGLHLELTSDLTASSFLRAFSRFKARRGNPKIVISDNGKTFTDAKVKAYCLRENITWKFNVEAAPWWGGFFERLLRSVKLCLKKSLRNVQLTFEELYN